MNTLLSAPFCMFQQASLKWFWGVWEGLKGVYIALSTKNIALSGNHFASLGKSYEHTGDWFLSPMGLENAT